jgi:transcriptional regulator with XRE-family HTH domain
MNWHRYRVLKKNDYYGNMNIVSDRIRTARGKSRLSQSELAAKMQVFNINLDQQMISKIERNMRIVTDYELAVFCKVLNVDIHWLLDDSFSKQG